MGLTTINISTLTNVANKKTGDWLNGKSNTRKTIQDRKTPSVASATKTDATSLLTKSVKDKVGDKVFNNANKATNILKNKLDIPDIDLNNTAIGHMSNNMVSKITKQLSGPGIPLNLKNRLRKAINEICNADSKTQFDLNSGLSSILSGYNLDELMKLVACLSDPIKLANITLSMLSSDLPNKQVVDGLRTTINTGKVTPNTALKLTTDSKGKDIIESNRDILKSLNKNVDKKELSTEDSSQLYNTLPSDNGSMEIYAEDKDNGIYSKLIDNKNNTKQKVELTNTTPTLDESSKQSIFMKMYNENKDKTVVM